ncbi:tRNA nucleotidyltransferase/poly(A) polymerase family protein [Besnoitia besnoiti]|uniref:tRNA nucleotidyltransferase/poly(A) polymerase family protein n=1 Tax=Besnoitia besnoiti TaxID=94643 RepID=A0A2A9MDA3_BESBE|nr:tRNA nucleotidyltransferase/poly(A) polymerase family protein [Besnoitia besnoiti]PFH33663.1 tRNA nucleotidyltransferase/poly(A) polymerase family protein [Besnoitia besnoiti]
MKCAARRKLHDSSPPFGLFSLPESRRMHLAFDCASPLLLRSSPGLSLLSSCPRPSFLSPLYLPTRHAPASRPYSPVSLRASLTACRGRSFSSSFSFTASSSPLQSSAAAPSSSFSSLSGGKQLPSLSAARRGESARNCEAAAAEDSGATDSYRANKGAAAQRHTTYSAMAAEHTAGEMETGPSLVLEPEEKRLFDMLVQCVEDLKLNIVLRAAGGWVRDKLMNRRCDDIDIAIDKCTGVEFATQLNNWLRAQGLPTHAIGVVASNPDQSKHLETATCRLCRHQVDFVHLRTEAYSEHSRIPESVDFGTPEEDALRRDFTLNALFYNLHTQRVENFTRTGLEDLRRRVLRTPLENAKVTLLDDPLRVLRGVRLAALLRLELHDEVVAGAQTKAVREGLRKKVSRERLGIELKKMLSGGAGPLEDDAESGEHSEQDHAAQSGVRGGEKELLRSSKKRRKSGGSRDDEGEEAAATLRPEEGAGEPGGAGEEEARGGAEGAEAREQNEQERRKEQRQIAQVAAAASRGFLLLTKLRVVESVFSLPDQILAASGENDGATRANGKRQEATAQTQKQNAKQHTLIPSQEDPALKGWRQDGLRCIVALAALLAAAAGASSPLTSVAAQVARGIFSPASDGEETAQEKNRVNGGSENGRNGEKKASAPPVAEWRDSLRALSLAAFLYPLAERTCLNEKSKPEDLILHMTVSRLKLAKRDGARAVDLNRGARLFLQFSGGQRTAAAEQEGDAEAVRDQRVQLGLLVRDAGGDLWPQALLLAVAIDQARKTRRFVSRVEHADEDEDAREERESSEAVERAQQPIDPADVERFVALKKQIESLGVATAHRLPPLCDGHKVKQLLKNLPKGPVFKEVLDDQVRWQLANPTGTAEECEAYLLTKYSAYV